MTIDEFCTLFATMVKPGDFYLLDGANGRIRTNCVANGGFGHCPLSYVAGTDPCGVLDAARKLALSKQDAALIGCAADNRFPLATTGAQIQRIRARLVAAITQSVEQEG